MIIIINKNIMARGTGSGVWGNPLRTIEGPLPTTPPGGFTPKPPRGA